MNILYNSGESKNPFVPKKALYILILIISDTGAIQAFARSVFHCTFLLTLFCLLLMHFSLTDF